MISWPVRPEFHRKACRRCRACVDTVPAADFNLQTEVAFPVSHTRHAVFVKNGHVLEGIGSLENLFDDNVGFRTISMRSGVTSPMIRAAVPDREGIQATVRPEALGRPTSRTLSFTVESEVR